MPTPEEKSRLVIDQKLVAAGWKVQDMGSLNFGAGLGVAVREFQTQSGPADYVLFVDRQALGVVEAKPKGTTLRGVAERLRQSILKRAFEGRLVTQRPEDGDTRELFVRIKQGKKSSE